MVQLIAAVLTAVILVMAAVDFAGNWEPRHLPFMAWDYEVYRDAGARWLAGDGYFQARQLAGPYEIVHGDVLYPPAALPLFALFSLLPAILWWIVPLGLIAWRTWALRPAAWSWPLLALCVWWPITLDRIMLGNPVMWLWAGMMFGAGSLVLLKPTLLPLALFGARTRAWWIAVAGIVALSAILLPLSLDYVRVLLDARTPRGIFYSVVEVPILLFPMIAMRARRGS